MNTTDGVIIEVARKPRGRPPGSRNKRKAPPPPPPPYRVLTPPNRPDLAVMCPYILEIPPGIDVINSLYHFCQRKNTGIVVLRGTGSVSNVTLRQPFTTSTVTFQGIFEILSLSATIITLQNPITNENNITKFSITFAGPQGQVYGGIVGGGELVAADTVCVFAASFNHPSFFRLSFEDGGDEERRSLMSSGNGGGGMGMLFGSDAGYPTGNYCSTPLPPKY